MFYPYCNLLIYIYAIHKPDLSQQDRDLRMDKFRQKDLLAVMMKQLHEIDTELHHWHVLQQEVESKQRTVCERTSGRIRQVGGSGRIEYILLFCTANLASISLFLNVFTVRLRVFSTDFHIVICMAHYTCAQHMTISGSIVELGTELAKCWFSSLMSGLQHSSEGASMEQYQPKLKHSKTMVWI